MTDIKFLENVNGKKEKKIFYAGDIEKLPKDRAQEFIDAGLAVEVAEKKEEKVVFQTKEEKFK